MPHCAHFKVSNFNHIFASRLCCLHELDKVTISQPDILQGLYDVLDRNTQLREPVLAMLMAQLKTYYKKNTDMNPPLKLEPCIIGQGDQVCLAEPLVRLVPKFYIENNILVPWMRNFIQQDIGIFRVS